MQRVQTFLRMNPQSLTHPLNDLLQGYTRNLVYTVAGLYFILHFFVAATWPQQFGWRLWIISLLILFTCAIVLYILPRNLIIAHICWQAGLISAITLGVYLLDEPGIACLYMLLPLSTTVILGWKGGLIVEFLIVGVILGFPHLLRLNVISNSFPLAIMIGGTTSVILGWAVMHVIVKVAHWSYYSIAEAQKNLEEAREHRSQVFKLSNQLDQAYHHLEHANAALIAYWQEAIAVKEAKSHFVTHVSHELRTPLNLIVGFSEMMLLSPESYSNVLLPAPYRSDINSIYRSAQHLLGLIDDVIDLERIDVGRISLTFDQVDIAALVTETTDLLRSYIHAKGLYLQVNIAEDLPLLRVDRLRVRQVLLNLITNAARFTGQGGICVDVTRQGDTLMFEITDTGQGISDGELPRIFDEFYSSNQTSSKWHSGSGLGLPISRKLVEIHQGQMGVKSTYRQGTTFWFTLPIPSNTTIPSQWQKFMVAQPTLWSGRLQKTLVVAQDDPPAVSLLRRHLGDYQFILEADVNKAITLAEKVKATALLVNEITPDLSTATAVPVIRCRLPTRQEVAASLRAYDVLAKPISQQDLVSALDRIDIPLRKVLIVDDDPEVVRLFRRMIQSRTPAPLCFDAHNGTEALELLKTERPDLMLLDLMMPEVNGYNVLAQLAENSALAHIKTIVISGNIHEIMLTQLPHSIELHKPNGLAMGELLRVLEGLLDGLTFDSESPSVQEVPVG